MKQKIQNQKNPKSCLIKLFSSLLFSKLPLILILGRLTGEVEVEREQENTRSGSEEEYTCK